jgi:hypothetical protein
LSLVPTAIGPPEGAPPIALSFDKLPLVQIRLLPRPLVQPPSFLLVLLELTQVVITTHKI